MTPVIAVYLMLSLSGFLTNPDNSAASSGAFAILISPQSITEKESFRVLIACEESVSTEMKVISPGGFLTPQRRLSGGGPPYWWAAEFKAENAGKHQILLKQDDSVLASKSFPVSNEKEFRKSSGIIWKTQRNWNRLTENLYSAWVEILFSDAGEGDQWNALHEVTRDPQKNLLHNYLSLGEDEQKGPNSLKLIPDCADNPFFLRAYFAWKLGLPYGNHKCSRGNLKKAPQCGQWISNHTQRKKGKNDSLSFQRFLTDIMNSIHSSSARTLLNSEAADLYPISLNKQDLRPGVVFADPYGHTLTITRWIPQTDKDPGLLLAVDAQPDGTIGIKRFWRGSFFFATANVVGEPGFKAFRPIMQENDRLRLLTNREISLTKDYGNYSLQQKDMQPQAFYDAIERIINPNPLDPEKAFFELHKAILERLLARVTAVVNGERYMQATGYRVIPMPSGVTIFQTTGPWEDYSTPSRDLRLLIALDVLLDFPDKVIRNPEAFRLPERKTPVEVKKELIRLRAQWAKEITITYTKSDGSQQLLSLEDIINRREALEAAYNPNDCVEIRWGTPQSSQECITCQRRAPTEQQNKMARYRHWFRKRIFPAR